MATVANQLIKKEAPFIFIERQLSNKILLRFINYF